jgi:hypothetical protein
MLPSPASLFSLPFVVSRSPLGVSRLPRSPRCFLGSLGDCPCSVPLASCECPAANGAPESHSPRRVGTHTGLRGPRAPRRPNCFFGTLPFFGKWGVGLQWAVGRGGRRSGDQVVNWIISPRSGGWGAGVRGQGSGESAEDVRSPRRLRAGVVDLVMP